MSIPPPAVEIPRPASTGTAADPELDALPKPRRPGKWVTLVTLTITALAALWVSFSLRGEAAYALGRGTPRDAGDLARSNLAAGWSNSWVRGEGELATEGAIRYSRPMDGDSFRLAPVAGTPKVWVEIRVPAGSEGQRFVPPTSFVGRLVPVAGLGVRHRGLLQSARSIGGVAPSPDAWLLIDGEDPASLHWSLGVVGVFVAFAAFNLWGIYRLLRPVES